jgi:hypothetical protein
MKNNERVPDARFPDSIAPTAIPPTWPANFNGGQSGDGLCVHQSGANRTDARGMIQPDGRPVPMAGQLMIGLGYYGNVRSKGR